MHETDGPRVPVERWHGIARQAWYSLDVRVWHGFAHDRVRRDAPRVEGTARDGDLRCDRPVRVRAYPASVRHRIEYPVPRVLAEYLSGSNDAWEAGLAYLRFPSPSLRIQRLVVPYAAIAACRQRCMLETYISSRLPHVDCDIWRHSFRASRT